MISLLLKLLLTAACVWLVLELARRAGERVAGLAAGLPVTTLPALVLLGADHGSAFVGGAALGGLMSTAACAMFAVVYSAAARRFGSAATLAAGCVTVAAGSAALASAPAEGTGIAAGAFAVALLACAFAARCIGTRPAAHRPPRRAGVHQLLVPLWVAGLSTGLCTFSTGLSAIACGLLTGLPVIGAAVVFRQHRLAGTESARQVLEGYVAGLRSRAAFTAVVALLAAPVGWPTALLLGAMGWALSELPQRTPAMLLGATAGGRAARERDSLSA